MASSRSSSSGAIFQWLGQRAPQQPRAGSRARQVQRLQQRRATRLPAMRRRLEDFQRAPGAPIDLDVAARIIRAQAGQQRQQRRIHALQIGEDRARRADGERQLIAAKRGEAGDAEVAAEADARALGLEVVRRAFRRDECAPRVGAILAGPFGEQDLGGRETLQFGEQRVIAIGGELGAGEGSGRRLDPGDTSQWRAIPPRVALRRRPPPAGCRVPPRACRDR